MPKASGLICCSDVESSLQFFTVCVGVDACEGGREREREWRMCSCDNTC